MGQFKTIPVESVNSITKEDFIKSYYKPQRPVLIKGFSKDWPAYKKWNLDYIQRIAGDQIVPLYDSKPTKGRKNTSTPAKKMKLYDYIEILKTQPTDLRMFFYNVLQKMPELTKDFTYPDVGMKFFKKLPVMFFGGKGSKVLAHYDMDLADLMHFHFHGTKSITLFAPDQTKYLYKVPFAIHGLEEIDMDNPDFGKYPTLKHVEGIQVNMEHGDALYMPSGYWHYIKYLDGGFSMTLRAFTRKPKGVATMIYNVFIARHFDNFMRWAMGNKWVNYKEERMVEKVNKKYKKQYQDA
ncbi:cupin-like domain-containing protein [Galbibacter sp. EGI 63066]|uniref:cupin-like domain-containing protein n=1 Tax=Galbibacter sp. EGI 63066 TaxID=2993559 RepID=UPI0022499C96|nr:cupin-like domain-containing protein [Galbibacter sp. EGI 63066]MCX2678353.1 cupin-like domain-containing protein [Galbibacter sp. EGI 63066]